MDESFASVDPLLLQLILSFHAGAMQQMGKIVSPLSGKLERNIEAARMSIDTMAMLEKKMAGNLSEEEAKLISHTLYELRINFVDESGKPDESSEESGPGSADGGSETSAAADEQSEDSSSEGGKKEDQN